MKIGFRALVRFIPYSTASLAAACAILAVGCAGVKPGSRYVEARDSVFVALPAIPAGLDSELAPLGWDGERFAAELRKELRYQLGRKGVKAPEDSVASSGRIDVTLDRYANDDFAGRARLTAAAGRREIPFAKGRKTGADRADPTIDNIRIIAAAIAEGAWNDPKRAREEKESYVPSTFILF
jgi:hypothetical protein